MPLPKKIIGKYYWVLLLALLGAGIYFFDIDTKELINEISKITPFEVLVLFFGALVLNLIDILLRYQLLAYLGFKTNIYRLSLIHFASMAANYSAPVKVGMPLTIYLLKRLEKVPYTIGSLSIIIGLVVSLGLCAGFTIAGSITYFSNQLTVNLKVIAIMTAILIGISILLKVLFEKMSGKVSQIWQNIHEGLSRLKPYQLLAYSLCRTIAIFVYSLYFIYLSQIFGYSLNLWQATIATTSSYFLGAISFVPMGLGVSEGTLAFCLSYFGVGKAVILGIVTLQRIFSTGIGFLFGLSAIILLGLKRNPADEVDFSNETKA